MIKIVGISISILFCSLMLKNYNKTFSAVLTIAGCSLLFIVVSDKISDIIKSVSSFSSNLPSSAYYIKLMVKVLGITLIAQFVSDTCKDNGETSLASITEMASKVIVISIMLPMFETVIKIITGLIK